MKILYLIEQPFDERNYDRFGIQSWIEAGWTVEVWNLMPFASLRTWEAIRTAASAVRAFDGCVTFTSKRDLQKRLGDHGKIDFFVDFTGDNRVTVAVKRRLARNGAVRIVGRLGSIPHYEGRPNSGLVTKARMAIAAGPKDWLAKAASKANAFFVARRIPPGVVIVSGRRSYDAAAKASHESQIVSAHNFDYDIFLRLNGAASGPPGPSARPYAVFLDQDLCYHPEFVFANLTPYVTPERYFPAIRQGLQALAGALGLDLRIAAHPRASYEHRGLASFGSIPIWSNQTAELIRDCTVVVCHSSTALQLAVLFEKPVIFATTDELAASLLGHYVEKFAAILGKSVIDLSGNLELVDWRKELRIDSEKYAAYRDEYIKMDGTENRPLWHLVIAHIENRVKAAAPTRSPISPPGRFVSPVQR